MVLIPRLPPLYFIPVHVGILPLWTIIQVPQPRAADQILDIALEKGHIILIVVDFFIRHNTPLRMIADGNRLE